MNTRSSLSVIEALLPWLSLPLLVFDANPAHGTQLLVPEEFAFYEARQTAMPGDTISVASGTFDRDGIALSGGPYTVLSRPPGENLLVWIEVRDSIGVQVVGFQVAWPGSGVLISDAEVEFIDCRFEELLGSPIPIEYRGTIDATFDRCEFRKNDNQIPSGEDIKGCIASQEATRTAGQIVLRRCLFEDQSAPVHATVAVTITDCTFRDCFGETLIEARSSLTMTATLVSGFRMHEGIYHAECLCSGVFRPVVWAFDNVVIAGNTFVDSSYEPHEWCPCPYPTPQETPPIIGLWHTTTGEITNNLFIGQGGAAVDAPAGITVACNDAYQSGDVNYRGGIGDVTGTNGNISQAPLFCGRAAGDYTISIYSPAAPENNDCGLMGAFDPVCEIEVPTARMGWGEFRARFGEN